MISDKSHTAPSFSLISLNSLSSLIFLNSLKITMKKYFSLILLAAGTMLLPGCMDNVDDPTFDMENNGDGGSVNIITSEVSVGEPNISILDLKTRYCSRLVSSSANFFNKVEEDLVIEGVVVGNDVSGNLYQTLLVRSIDEAAGTDQCIQVAIQNTCLHPFFPLGQRIRVNLKDLHIGCYSYVPKVGEPYITSKGNKRLGAMKMPMCKTHIQLIGAPNPNAKELIPLDYTDPNTKFPPMLYDNVPLLAKVRGVIAEVQGGKAIKAQVGEKSSEAEPLPKIYAPECLYDDGYGVNRTIETSGRPAKEYVILRTSTGNEVANTVIPVEERTYTGMLTYYNGERQIVVRDLNDIAEISE